MANKKRLIDINALSDLLDVEYRRKIQLVRKGEKHLDTLAEGIMSVSILLGTMPTVDAVEVVHGRWNRVEVDLGSGIRTHRFACSECAFLKNTLIGNYCPNCGAKMDGGAEDGK